MLSHPTNRYPLLHINLKYFEKEVIKEYLFLPAAEEAFRLDVVVESEPCFAFGYDIV